MAMAVSIFTMTMLMLMWLLSALRLPLLIHLILLLMLILLLSKTLSSPPCNNEPSLLLSDQDDRPISLLTNILMLLCPLAVHFSIQIGCK